MSLFISQCHYLSFLFQINSSFFVAYVPDSLSASAASMDLFIATNIHTE